MIKSTKYCPSPGINHSTVFCLYVHVHPIALHRLSLKPTFSQLSSSVANDLFQLFSGRSGSKIAPNGELIAAFGMVSIHSLGNCI